MYPTSVDDASSCKETIGFPVSSDMADPSARMNSQIPKVHDYDPFKHAINKNPSTFLGTIFHIIFLAAGSLVLFLPKKIVSVGYLNGCLLLLLIFLFYGHNMRSILWSSYEICKLKKIPTITYAELVFEAFDIGVTGRRLAPLARLLIRLDFILVWFNASVFIYLLMAEYFTAICAQVLHLDVSTKQVMIILLIPALTINSIHKLKYLEPLSVIGFAFSSITAGVILFNLLTDQLPWQWPTNQIVIDKVPIFVGSIMVTINLTGLIIPLRDEMKSPRNFVKPFGVMNIAFLTNTSVYCFLAIIFAAKYNTNVPENLILILPPHSILTHISLILYAISLLFLYSLILYVPFDVILNDFLKDSRKLTCSKIRWDHLLKCFLVIVCFFLAYANPDVSLFFTISGTVGTSIDSIIFPAVVQTLVQWKVGTSRLKFTITLIKNSIIFAIGLSLVIAGIQDCIQVEEQEFRD